MPDEKKDAKSEDKPSDAKAEPVERERLLSESQRLLDEPAHVVAGALANVAGDGPVDPDRVRKEIEAFQKREMKEA